MQKLRLKDQTFRGGEREEPEKEDGKGAGRGKDEERKFGACRITKPRKMRTSG